MKGRLKSIGFCSGLVLAGIAAGFQLRAQGQATPAGQAPALAAPADTTAMRAEYEQWRKDYKTWGKWGTDDNKGTSNFITPKKVLSAVKLAKTGTVVFLALYEPQVPAADVTASGVFHRVTNCLTFVVRIKISQPSLL